MTDSSPSAFCTTMMVVAVLALSTLSVVSGQTSCAKDEDCPRDQYCYNVSAECVNFTPCSLWNRIEGPRAAKESFQCGPCAPGYAEELLGTGLTASSCKKMLVSEGTQTESEYEVPWSWHWIVITVVAIVLVLILIGVLLNKFFCSKHQDKMCVKMMSWTARPTAPPQDEGESRSSDEQTLYHLRGKAFIGDEERPPIYSSVIGTNIDKANLVNASPVVPPTWINKPHYDPDYNDNVADGVAMPIQSSSTNLQMDTEEEEMTTPSSWTPNQMTVEVPNRPFARFANEQHDNALNNVLLRTNHCSTSSQEDDNGSNGGNGPAEEPSGSRSQGDIFCGPNVQINQTITLNISKNDMK